MVNDALSTFLEENPGVGKAILEKCINASRAREAARKARELVRRKKTIRVIILGIPNVGKSSIINRLCNKKTTVVGNRPGVTKQKQWIKLDDGVELMDTPGVLWPKFENQQIAMNLAFTGTIKDDILEKTEVI